MSTDIHLRQALREKSHKVTPARLAVLRLLEKAKRPLPVEAIMKRLKQDSFDQATVYRTLTTLKQSGLVRQVDFHHDHAYFELASLGEHHHHAICVRCEAVVDIQDCCLETMNRTALRQSGFAMITQHSLEFFGLCKRCVAR